MSKFPFLAQDGQFSGSSVMVCKLQVSSLLGRVMESLHDCRVGLGEGWLTSTKQEHQWGQDNLSGATAVSAVMDIHVSNLVAGRRAHGVWVSAC